MTRLSLLLASAALLGSPAMADKIFVSNANGNSVSVLDAATLEVIHTIEGIQRPRGITASPDGKVLYVCASDDNLVRVYDTTTYEELPSLPSGADPDLFVLHPSGNSLYVSNENDNIVTVVDVTTRQVLAKVPVGVEPEGMGVHPDGTIVVSTSETTNMAHMIDTKTFEVVANVLVDSRPRFAQYNSDGSKLFVSAEIGGTVSVIDTATNEIIHKITFALPGVLPEALQPVGVRLTADDSRIFVALGPSNRVAVVTGKTFEVDEFLLVGQRVWHLGFSPDGRFLYTTNGNSNDMSVIDVEANKVIKTVQVGEQPWGVVAVSTVP